MIDLLILALATAVIVGIVLGLLGIAIKHLYGEEL